MRAGRRPEAPWPRQVAAAHPLAIVAPPQRQSSVVSRLSCAHSRCLCLPKELVRRTAPALLRRGPPGLAPNGACSCESTAGAESAASSRKKAISTSQQRRMVQGVEGLHPPPWHAEKKVVLSSFDLEQRSSPIASHLCVNRLCFWRDQHHGHRDLAENAGAHCEEDRPASPVWPGEEPVCGQDGRED